MSQESTLLKSVTERVTANMLATPVTAFMTPQELAKHPTFANIPNFDGFKFHHETELANLNALSGTVGMFILNTSIKEDHSYSFFPDLGSQVSPVLLFELIKVLHANGYHVARSYHHMLFGIKTPS